MLVQRILESAGCSYQCLHKNQELMPETGPVFEILMIAKIRAEAELEVAAKKYLPIVSPLYRLCAVAAVAELFHRARGTTCILWHQFRGL